MFSNGRPEVALQGGIAQLGERLHGMQEVIGSIPFTSTIKAVGEVLSFQGRAAIRCYVALVPDPIV
jgi:hypothetical protein